MLMTEDTEEECIKTVIVPENESCCADWSPDSDGLAARLVGFQVQEDGRPGIIERTDNIKLGDVLISINDFPLCWTSHAATMKIIRDISSQRILKFLSADDYKQKSLSCGIVDVDQTKDHAVYELVCRLKVIHNCSPRTDIYSWSVKKRFSELKSFHYTLKKSLGAEIKHVDFPSNYLLTWNKKSDSFLGNRKNELSKYWGKIMSVDVSQEWGILLHVLKCEHATQNASPLRSRDQQSAATMDSVFSALSDVSSASTISVNSGVIEDSIPSINVCDLLSSNLVSGHSISTKGSLSHPSSNYGANPIRLGVCDTSRILNKRDSSILLLDYSPTLCTAIEAVTDILRLCDENDPDKNIQLLSAVKIVASLLDPVFVNRTYNKCTLLHYLCKLNNLESVRLILSNPCIDVNALDGYGCTALMVVAKSHQNLDVVAELLKRGADVSLTSANEMTVFDYANLTNNVVNRRLLFMLHAYKNVEMPSAQILSKFNSTLGQVFEIDETDDNGDTLLMILCRRSLPALVEIALDLGASIDKANKKEETPLFLSMGRVWWNRISAPVYQRLYTAILGNEMSQIKRIFFEYPWLMDFSSDDALSDMIVNMTGVTPLLFAILFGKVCTLSVVLKTDACLLDKRDNDVFQKMSKEYVRCLKKISQKLIDHGSQLIHFDVVSAVGISYHVSPDAHENVMATVGSIIMCHACRHGFASVAADVLSIQNGKFNINRVFVNRTELVPSTYKMFTLLFLAIFHGHSEVVKILLEHGAEANLCTTAAMSCLALAVIKNDAKIVDLLLSYKADVNFRLEDRSTALHYAVKNLLVCKFDVTVSIARSLLCKGAQSDIENKSGKTVLLMSKSKPWYPLVSKALTKSFTLAIESNNIEDIKYFHSVGMEYDCYGNHMLVQAVRYSSDLVVLDIVKLRVNVNSTNSDGTTALMWAVMLDRPYIVQVLMEAGARSNLLDNFGNDISFYGCNSAAMKKMKEFKPGSSVVSSSDDSIKSDDSGVGSTGSSVREMKDLCRELRTEIRGRNMPSVGFWLGFVFQLLLSDRTAPHELIQHAVKLVSLRSGVDINTIHMVSTKECLLHSICRLNCLSLAVMLLNNAYLDVNAPDSEDRTALMIVAMTHKNLDMIALLLKHGADPYLRDRTGKNSMSYAATEISKVRLYLCVCMYLNKCPPFPVRHCVENNLLSGDFDINDTNSDGDTLQMIWCREQRSVLVHMTIHMGADPEIRNNQGETALSLSVNKCWWKEISFGSYLKLFDAVSQDNDAEVTRLISVGVDLNEPIKMRDYVAFFITASTTFEKDLQTLDTLKMNWKIKNSKGQSLFLYSCIQGHFESVRVLLSAYNVSIVDVDGENCNFVELLSNNLEALKKVWDLVDKHNSVVAKKLLHDLKLAKLPDSIVEFVASIEKVTEAPRRPSDRSEDSVSSLGTNSL